ncbi:MAG TPA: DUF4340 domain-containing protein [Burkholderiales bacterium]|nr:DUF4340 domain-containing protein [Burkholderiales bacterium]
MNRKQFLIMVALVAILGGAGLAMFWKDISGYKESGAKIGAKVLPSLKAADATEIHLKDDKNEVTLLSKKGSWSVKERGGYPADVGQISELLAMLVEAKIVQSETIGESLYPRLNLGEPGKGEGSGTLLELKDKAGQPIAKLIFGKVSLKKDPGNPLPNAVDGVPAGRYMVAPGKIQSVVVVSDPFANVDAKPGKWLAKNFFKADRIKTLTVDEGAAQWKITRELEYSQWKFAAGAGQLDPSAAVAAVNALGQLAFSDVSPEAKVEGDGVKTIVAETFDNLTYTLKVAKQKTGDDYLFNFVLTGAPPKTRVPEKDEKPDEIERRAKEYVDTLKRLEARAEFEKILGQWTYVMPAKAVEPILKERAQMVVQPRKAGDEKGGPPPGMMPGFPR